MICEKVPVCPITDDTWWQCWGFNDSSLLFYLLFFWTWSWILSCPKVYCSDVFSALFMISCFSVTEEICPCYIFTQTLCFLLRFRWTSVHLAQLGWGWGLSKYRSLTEQLSPKCDFSLRLWAPGKPSALDQVELTEREQKHQIQTTIYGIMRNRHMEHDDIVVLLDWIRVFEYW